MKWREHITWQEYGSSRASLGGYWGYSDSKKHPTNICKDWKACPECGAKRPEKEKGLADKLKQLGTEIQCNPDWIWKRDYYKESAQVALEHFIKIIETLPMAQRFNHLGLTGEFIDSEMVIEKMRESL